MPKIVQTSTRVELHPTGTDTSGPVYVDFLSGSTAHRTRFAGKESILKAVGVTGTNKPKVLDLTAGLGQDSYILASNGCDVLMLERSPEIAQLLADGLQRAQQDAEFAKLKLSFKHVDSLAFLKHVKQNEFEVIYLDPMFPERTKSALVKKEMRLLREVVGVDPDADKLLPLALQKASKRVVVKRPRLAPFLNDQEPHWQIMGKRNRFDVYLPKSG